MVCWGYKMECGGKKMVDRKRETDKTKKKYNRRNIENRKLDIIIKIIQDER